jgi:molecular chaperone IbpA
LSEYVEVKGADLKNGILSISLVKVVPESARPKKIEIGSTFIQD